jgi:signal transduction histidine kinase
VGTTTSSGQVERFVAPLRVFGLLAGVLLVGLTTFPDEGLRTTALTTLVLLTVATALTWAWGRRSRWTNPALVHVGFVVDVCLILGYAVSFAHIEPSVSWSVAFTMLADAIYRYGVRGAVPGYLLGVVVFLVQARVHQVVTGERTPLVGVVFALSTLFGVAGVMAVLSHLLERRAGQQRDQALALADALEAQERGVAATAHEFRGALAVIVGAAQTARTKRERLDPAELDALLADIESQGRQVQDLVAGLASAGPDRLGGMAIRARSDDVGQTVRRAVDACERHRRNHDLQVTLPRLQCGLDHERLYQVTRNLVDNAYRHTDPGTRVSVAVRRLGVTVELAVVDNGPGIPAETQQRALDPFRRRGGGEDEPVGFGLYLVRQIVAAMGGTLELRASPHGTKVLVRVPAAFGDRAP